jgi:hypothetical protein
MEPFTLKKRSVLPLWMLTPVPMGYMTVYTTSINAFGYNTRLLVCTINQFKNMCNMLWCMFHHVNHANMFDWQANASALCWITHLLCVNYGLSPIAFPTVPDMIFWASEKVPMTDMLKSVCYKYLAACDYVIPSKTIYVDTDPGYKFTVDLGEMVDDLVGSS